MSPAAQRRKIFSSLHGLSLSTRARSISQNRPKRQNKKPLFVSRIPVKAELLEQRNLYQDILYSLWDAAIFRNPVDDLIEMGSRFKINLY